MTDSRKIIRVFLASPGDLEEERKIVRDVVNEFNDSWADEFGYQVELMGWEDTVAGYGRPQHLINQELDRCDLFIGMMWKRWGTPPDSEGLYTSGFHEEFARSVARREQSGKPEIALYFKEIPTSFMDDPGTDLKKVLIFKNDVIAKKQFLFHQFSDAREIEALARRRVNAYVRYVKADDRSSETHEDNEKRAKSGAQKESDEPKRPGASPLRAEGFNFLEALVKRIAQDPAMDDVSASDIARFRLQTLSRSRETTRWSWVSMILTFSSRAVSRA